MKTATMLKLGQYDECVVYRKKMVFKSFYVHGYSFARLLKKHGFTHLNCPEGVWELDPGTYSIATISKTARMYT